MGPRTGGRVWTMPQREQRQQLHFQEQAAAADHKVYATSGV